MRAEPSPAALPFSLLLLRIGITIVMGFWTVDKIVNPAHAGAVFKSFYGLGGVGDQTLLIIAIVEGLIVLAFAAGLFKTMTYGAVLLMHSVSTLSSWRQYLEPFDNMLFLAAWPMLAACVALFLMRDHDRLLAWPGREAQANDVNTTTRNETRRGGRGGREEG